MPTIEKFDDVQAWQEARTLTKIVYRLTGEGHWAKDFGLRDQIRRASVSVMSNIAEGFERRGDTEFYRFLAIAKASAAEVKSQLYVGLDMSYIDIETFEKAYEQTDKTARMIGKLMSYLKQE